MKLDFFLKLLRYNTIRW